MKQILLLVTGLVFFSLTPQKTNLTKAKKRDYVPNAETAVKIAEAIWLPIYGEDIYSQKPYLATLEKDSIWIVKGTLNATYGGVAYIEINKKDCKILKVTHGK